jgi:anti-anti-sigma factor
MQPNLKLTVEKVTGNYQVIKFNGEFDKAGHSEVKKELDKVVNDFSVEALIFDFSGLKFINSEGIGYLMEIHTHLVTRSKKLVILGLAANVKDVFQAIGINEIISIYENMDAYLNQ